MRISEVCKSKILRDKGCNKHTLEEQVERLCKKDGLKVSILKRISSLIICKQKWFGFFLIEIKTSVLTILMERLQESFINIVSLLFRRNRSQIFLKINVFKHFANYSRKHLRWLLLLIKRIQHKCFPVKFPKFVRTSFFTGRLQCLFLFFTELLETSPRNFEIFEKKCLK